MSDELVTMIAAALSAQGRELLVAGSKSALTSLIGVIRQRFTRDPAEAEVLEAAISRPGDDQRIAALSGLLATAMAQDPEFAAQVFSHWQAAVRNEASGSDAVVNSFNGNATKVVQMRDVHGGLSL